MDSDSALPTTLSGDDGLEAAQKNLENLDFESQRNLIVALITSMTSNVKERDRMKRDKSTHPLAHIKLSTKLESQVIAAYNHLDMLKAIYSKLCGMKKKRKFSDDEMRAFEETVDNLEENLQTLENTIRYRTATISRPKADLDVNAVSFDQATLSLQEQNFVADSIKKWNERDEGFDKQLVEIGEAVDRIGEVAVQIGTRAQDQANLAIETVSQFENTTKGITDVTGKMKQLLRRQRLVECYCRFILVVIVLVLSGVLMYMLIKRLR